METFKAYNQTEEKVVDDQTDGAFFMVIKIDISVNAAVTMYVL
jgi:hypothetical protein